MSLTFTNVTAIPLRTAAVVFPSVVTGPQRMIDYFAGASMETGIRMTHVILR